MPNIIFRTTEAGIAKHASQIAAGLSLVLARAEFGSGQYVVDGTEVALMTPLVPVKSFDNVVVEASGGEVQYSVLDETQDTYNVGEIGIFDEDGVLFAIASQEAVDGFLLIKGPNILNFINRFVILGILNPNITFPLPTWPSRRATTIVHGLVKFAPTGDYTDPDDAVRATEITNAVAGASQAVAGKVRFADNAEIDGGLISGKVTHPAGVKRYLDSRIGTDANNLVALGANGRFPSSVIPPVQLTTTFDASAIVSGTLNTSRIPNLSANKITSGVLHIDRIPSLSASKTTSGQFSTQRIPNLSANKITTGILGSGRIPNLSASKITSGTFNVNRIPGLPASRTTSGTFSGSRIPNLSTSKITSGTFDLDRLPIIVSPNDPIAADWSPGDIWFKREA